MAAIPTIVGTFFATFDWQHSLLLGGAIIGGVVAGIGILLELEKWSTAAILVMIGIIMEPIFTIGLFLYDESLGRAQQSKIVSLDCKNNTLENVLEAFAPRILLLHRLNSRINIPEQRAVKFASDLGEYSNILVKIQSVEENEPENLAADLKQVLTGAHWSVQSTNPSESKFSSSDIQEGVTIWRSAYVLPNMDGPADALRAAFLNAGIGAQLGLMPNAIGVTVPNFSDANNTIGDNGFLYVAIGTRPIDSAQLANLSGACP